MWKSDGTPGGTELITSFTGIPDYLTNVNGILFFSGYDDINGWGLWKSDGTAGGTMMVKDILSGSPGSSLINFFNSNGVLYFTSSAGNIQVWKSDGTPAGTVLVKDGYQQNLVTLPFEFAAANGVTLLFSIRTTKWL